MYKESPMEAFGDFGKKASVIDFTEDGFDKVASLATHIPENLAKTIQEIEKTADPNNVYLYDRAMGAGEAYGANNNGDWFGRDELIRNHPTFVKCAHVFRHHQNKDPRNAIGSVVDSAYNYELDTVDLILSCPKDKVEADMKKFASGGSIATSMGAKVAFDICSICGNEAKSRYHYCSHLRNHMLRTYPDGRQVKAINPNPRFVDISMVVIGADPSSTVLRKIAELGKMSVMKKDDVGGNIEQRGVINPALVDATNHLDRAEALATIHKAQGTLRPDEFAAIIRKDASLINPNVIPCVTFKVVPKIAMASNPLWVLADAMSEVGRVTLNKNASIIMENFLSDEERHAYLQYRNQNFTREFLR